MYKEVNKKKECDQCFGTGTVLCPKCDATGKNMNGQKCSFCEGAELVICDKCSGSGIIEVFEKQIAAVVIEPGQIPMPTFISDDILELAKEVNIDKDGNRHPDVEGFEIVGIKDDISIISSPKGIERDLPLLRSIGQATKLYGKIYIVNITSGGGLYSLSDDDVVKYCVTFLKDELSLSDFGFDEVKASNAVTNKVTNPEFSDKDDIGERNVDYALKWLMSSYHGDIEQIKRDCIGKYGKKCILIKNDDFIDEPQEYDHILVCSAGIILIETKHWKGCFEIRPDGKWIKKDSDLKGIENPKFQMRRHELLMKSLFPGVPVHSFLCFSNGDAIIDGKENFVAYPIIRIDEIEEAITQLDTIDKYTKHDIDKIVAVIEEHKV